MKCEIIVFVNKLLKHQAQASHFATRADLLNNEIKSLKAESVNYDFNHAIRKKQISVIENLVNVLQIAINEKLESEILLSKI